VALWHGPNPARNLDGAKLGWIFEKWPDAGFVGAEIWYNPIKNQLLGTDVVVYIYSCTIRN